METLKGAADETTGARQGCILSPHLFLLELVWWSRSRKKQQQEMSAEFNG